MRKFARGDRVIVNGYGAGHVLTTFGVYDVYVSLALGGKMWAGPEELTMAETVG